MAIVDGEAGPSSQVPKAEMTPTDDTNKNMATNHLRKGLRV